MNLVKGRRTPWKIINPQKESYAKQLYIYTGDNREGDKNFDGKSLATETMFLFFGGPSHALNLQTFLMESEF